MFTSHINLSKCSVFTPLMLAFSVCISLTAAAQYEPALTIPIADTEEIALTIAFSPDGNRIIRGGPSLTLLDAATGQESHTYTDDGNSGYVVYSPNGKLVAAAYPNITPFWLFRVKLWDLETGRSIHTLEYSIHQFDKAPRRNEWIAMAFSPDGKRLLTGDAASRLVSWNTETGEMIHEYMVFDHPTPDLIIKLAFLPNGRQIMAQQGSDVNLVSLETDEIEYEIYAASDFSMARDGTRFIIPDTRSAGLYDVETGESIRTYPVQYTSSTREMEISPDGKLILVAGRRDSDHYYSRVIINTETGEQLREYPECDDRWIQFSPDGKRFLAVDRLKNAICVYDVSDLQSAVREAPEYERKEE
ncbi:MAG: hypothetical protein ABIH23_13425 [bacterium]